MVLENRNPATPSGGEVKYRKMSTVTFVIVLYILYRFPLNLMLDVLKLQQVQDLITKLKFMRGVSSVRFSCLAPKFYYKGACEVTSI